MGKPRWKHRIAVLVGSATLAIVAAFGFKAYLASAPTRSSAEGPGRNVDASMADAINGFSMALLRKTGSDSNNLVLSPFSVFMALAVVSESAGGQTRLEFGRLMRIGQIDHSFHERVGGIGRQMVDSVAGTSGQLNVANGLWISKLAQAAISHEFTQTIRQNYEAEIREMDVRQSPESASHEINDWVKTKTRGKIDELFSSGQINQATPIVVVNAIYFKCPWAIRFKPGFTSPDFFKRLDGSRIKVPMMRTSSDDYRYSEQRGLQILELPYQRSAVSMIMLLPRETDGLVELEKSLTPSHMNSWLGKLAKHRGGVQVYLPRFSVRSRLGLIPTLKSMGLKDAFDAHKADFSRLFQNPVGGVSISDIVHESRIEVNEEGTEAAAATGVGDIYAAGDRPQAKVFRADHPFMFIIYHKPSGCILFMGRVTDPSKMN